MAEFCKQCSEDIFNEDMKGFAGLSTPEDTEKDLYPMVPCEGCGFVQVDHTGKCVTLGCLRNHNPKPPDDGKCKN